MSESTQQDTLPFARGKQESLIAHAVRNEFFFSKTIGLIKPEWFHDPVLGRIWKAMINHYGRYKARPTETELKESQDFMAMSQQERSKHQGLLMALLANEHRVGLEILLNELSVWNQARVLQVGVPQVADLYNKGSVDLAAKRLKTLVQEFSEASQFDSKEEKFGNFAEEFKHSILSREGALTIGNKYFDHILDSQCNPDDPKPQGALHKGEMSVVLAPTSSGKSTLLITSTIANVKRGKKILYISHEDPKLTVKMNFRKAFAGKTYAELKKIYEHPQGLQVLGAIDDILGKHITYLPLNKVGLTVEEVLELINQYNQRQILETGTGFDMIVDDYPSRLTLARGVRWEKRQIIEEIYQQFAQLALDLDCHVLTAMQVNREGNKINKRVGAYENASRLLSMENSSESFAPMMLARLVMTINRTPFDVEKNLVTFLCAKTKQGAADQAITMECFYDKSLSFTDKSKCFWYRGDVSVSKFAEEILRNNNGAPGRIDDHAVLAYSNRESGF